MTPKTQENYQKYLVGNYGTPAGEMVRGEGAYVWDASQKRYLDFGSGIAVNSLGHCHPRWIAAINAQIRILGHTSNLYAHAGQGELAARLCEKAGDGRLLFCNSGAEANEACLKIARLHGRRLTGSEGIKYKVLTAEKAFHGRTFGAMAATPQEKIQGGFRPMLQGFAHGILNDLQSFEALIDDSTAAIFVETIQGEGGLAVCTPEFLRGLRALCDRHQLLLIIDEVQCGIGRTGDFFAYEASGIRPDVIAMAKGLAGGLPIGAVWIRPEYANLFTPGSHGTTFGGGPVVCAAALAVLDVIESEGLMASIKANDTLFAELLNGLMKEFPSLIVEVRGRGYMRGLRLTIDPGPVMQSAFAHGLLSVRAGDQVLRLLPPLTAKAEHLIEAAGLLQKAFRDLASRHP